VYCSDGDLVKTTGMKIIQGRDINLKNFLTDSFAAVINEAAVKAMSFKNPIGQNLRYDTNYHVIGVVKDFIIESPYEPIRPIVVMGPHNQFFNTIHIKLNKENSTAKNIAAIGKNIQNNIILNILSNTNSLMKRMRRNLPANR